MGEVFAVRSACCVAMIMRRVTNMFRSALVGGQAHQAGRSALGTLGRAAPMASRRHLQVTHLLRIWAGCGMQVAFASLSAHYYHDARIYLPYAVATRGAAYAKGYADSVDSGVEFNEAGDSGLRVATLARPRALNALNLDMVRALTPVIQQWNTDPTTSVIVIDGAGDKVRVLLTCLSRFTPPLTPQPPRVSPGRWAHCAEQRMPCVCVAIRRQEDPQGAHVDA